MTITDGWALASGVIGIALIVWKSKRRFSRLNTFGIEQFRSLSQKILAQGFDALLLGVGGGLIVVSVSALIWLHYSELGWLVALAFIAVGVERIFSKSR